MLRRSRNISVCHCSHFLTSQPQRTTSMFGSQRHNIDAALWTIDICTCNAQLKSVLGDWGRPSWHASTLCLLWQVAPLSPLKRINGNESPKNLAICHSEAFRLKNLKALESEEMFRFVQHDKIEIPIVIASEHIVRAWQSTIKESRASAQRRLIASASPRNDKSENLKRQQKQGFCDSKISLCDSMN